MTGQELVDGKTKRIWPDAPECKMKIMIIVVVIHLPFLKKIFSVWKIIKGSQLSAYITVMHWWGRTRCPKVCSKTDSRCSCSLFVQHHFKCTQKKKNGQTRTPPELRIDTPWLMVLQQKAQFDSALIYLSVCGCIFTCVWCKGLCWLCS